MRVLIIMINPLWLEVKLMKQTSVVKVTCSWGWTAEKCWKIWDEGRSLPDMCKYLASSNSGAPISAQDLIVRDREPIRKQTEKVGLSAVTISDNHHEINSWR